MTSPARRKTTAASNSGSFASKTNTVPGIAAQLSGDRSPVIRLLELARLGTKPSVLDEDGQAPVDRVVLREEFRKACPAVGEDAFDHHWRAISEGLDEVDDVVWLQDVADDAIVPNFNPSRTGLTDPQEVWQDLLAREQTIGFSSWPIHEPFDDTHDGRHLDSVSNQAYDNLHDAVRHLWHDQVRALRAAHDAAHDTDRRADQTAADRAAIPGQGSRAS